jgi:non-ribosomal peptide synthetase component E (peptide arylation enzyme)
MNAHRGAPRPEDVYSEATIAGFRSSGHWRDEVLARYVERWAEEDPDRVVLTDVYSSLTTAQLRRSAYRFAAALRGLGVEPGDRVLVQLPNWNEFVVVYVALARIGAVLVPQMPIYRDDEVGTRRTIPARRCWWCRASSDPSTMRPWPSTSERRRPSWSRS